MKVWYEETYGDVLTLRVIQEWAGAGLRWEWIAKGGLFGDRRESSGGCFYRGTPDDRIHGLNDAEVIQTALNNVRKQWTFPDIPFPTPHVVTVPFEGVV